MERELDKIFDVEPMSKNMITNNPVKQAQTALAVAKQNYDLVFNGEVDERFNEDFEEIRSSLKDMIMEMGENMQKLSLIAQESEKAAHFSALSQIATTMLNANKQLLEIYSEKKRYLTKKEQNEPTGDIKVQNAIFTGTTSDLKEWIKSQKI